EAINHHSQFFGFFFTDAAFNGSRVRAVWNSRRMQCELTFLNVVAAHKIPVHVIQNFICIDIAVVVRRGYGFRMVVVHSWHKRTDYKVSAFKLLMNRRWHVYPAGNGLKIKNGEGVRIVVSIPAYQIKGM